MKKIIDWFKKHKKLCVGLVIVVIIIIGFICCSSKTKALNNAFPEVNYGTWEYVGYLSNIDTYQDYQEVDIEGQFKIVNNELVVDDSFTSTYRDEEERNEYVTGVVYIFKLDVQGYIIQDYMLFNEFLNEQVNYNSEEYFNRGYETALSDSSSDIYSQGYNIGYEEGIISGMQTQNTIISDKNATIAQQQALIDELTEALEEDNKGFKFATFGQLLSAIVSYPIQFFKEGLNVEVFGINVGAFIVAIVLISVTIGVIGIVLHGRKKE